MDVSDWLADLEDYFLGNFGPNLEDTRKLAILRQVFGKTHLGTVKELISRLTADDRVKYDAVKTAIITHFGKST